MTHLTCAPLQVLHDGRLLVGANRAVSEITYKVRRVKSAVLACLSAEVTAELKQATDIPPSCRSQQLSSRCWLVGRCSVYEQCAPFVC